MSHLLDLLVALSAKALVLVALGALAARALSRASAACRHVLWTAVLGGVLVVALAAPLPAPWALPLAVPLELLRSDAPVHEASAADAAEASATVADASTSGASNRASRLELVPVSSSLLWIAGAGMLLARLVVGRCALRRLGARGRLLGDGPAAVVLAELAGGRRALRKLRLIECDALRLPATWGTLRPVIALPAGAAAWPRERLAAVLAHELAHVRRRDSVTRLAADACCALLWFHPAVWFARRRMRVESERACDDAVLSAGTAGVGYAETLLALAASSRVRAAVPSAIAMAGAEDLEGRMRAILDPATPRSSSRALMLSVPALALVASTSMAAFDLRGAELRADGARDTAAAEFSGPDDAKILSGERVPFTLAQERAALARRFAPRDEDEARALALLRAATEHGPQHPFDLVRERALWALSIADPDQVIGPLIDRLARADWRERAYAAWCLGAIGAPRALDGLAARLDDPVWRVRAAAAAAFAELADPLALDDVLACLDDDAWQVRMAAVEYLGRVGTLAARAAVRRTLADPHVAVRTAAETALGAPPVR